LFAGQRISRRKKERQTIYERNRLDSNRQIAELTTEGNDAFNHVGEKGEVEKNDASTNREGSKSSRKPKEVVEQATTFSKDEEIVDMNHAKQGKKDDDAKQQEKSSSKSIQQDTAVVNQKTNLSHEEKMK